MNHASLFTGIGGFDLAAEWIGWENVFQVEWDKYCQKVLTKNFPNVTRYGDIKKFDGTKYKGLVNIISGGFPCQPFSNAGKRKGKEDDRYLWPEMLRVIREIKPSYVVGENVNGLVSMADGETLDRILSDMEGEGYQTEQFIIPACSVGAWHRRARIWIISYSNCSRNSQSELQQTDISSESSRRSKQVLLNSINSSDRAIREQKREENSIQREYKEEGLSRKSSGTSKQIPSNINNEGLQRSQEAGDSKSCREESNELSSRCYRGGEYWEIEPNVGRVANGVSNRVDRLKGLGNAIVPQVAYQIFKAIQDYETI